VGRGVSGHDGRPATQTRVGWVREAGKEKVGRGEVVLAQECRNASFFLFSIFYFFRFEFKYALKFKHQLNAANKEPQHEFMIYFIYL
jgi:hypothetical protein